MTLASNNDLPPPSPPSPLLGPLLSLHLATPVLPSSATLHPAPSEFSVSRISAPAAGQDDEVEKQEKRSSKNNLFDQSWAPVAPPPAPPPPLSPVQSAGGGGGRSRSSTASSSWSAVSSSGSSARRSWMDVDSPPLSASLGPPPSFPLQSPGGGGLSVNTALASPGADRTPLPSAQKKPEDGYGWPLTPPSPAFSASASATAAPPLPPPVPPVPLLPPAPLSPPRAPTLSRTGTALPFSPSSASRESTLPPTAGHSSNPLLDTRSAPSLRLSPSPAYLLGEGRHASVYLASFSPRSPADGAGSVRAERKWTLCAAKRFGADRESQVAGLGEAFILAKLSAPSNSSVAAAEEGGARRLDGSKHILGLHGVRDERDGVDAPLPLPASAVSTPQSPLGGLSRAGSVRSRRSVGGAGGEGVRSPLRATFPSSDSSSSLEAAAGPAQEIADGDHAEVEARRAHSLRLPSTRSRPRLSEPLRLSSAAGKAAGMSVLTSLDPASTRPSRRISLHHPSPPSPSSPTPITNTGFKSASPPTPAAPRITLLLQLAPHGHVLAFCRANPEMVDGPRWVTWARELAAAVRWCHQKGVLHGDLKPQNILLSPTLTPLLSDFSTSLFLPPASSPPSAWPTDPHGLGTPQYSPPEFVRPLPSPFSYPSDVFSLGVTLGTLLTGREPYEGTRVVERMLHVSAGGWWDFEERRRLRELDASEAEVEEGTLSRAGSVRSVRSGRSSLRGTPTRGRREESVESVRSFASTADGGFAQREGGRVDWEAGVRSLLGESWDEEGLEVPPLPSSSLPAAGQEGDAKEEWAGEGAFYPHTTTPLQFFPSAPPPVSPLSPSFASSPPPRPKKKDVVPLAVRELLRRMTLPAMDERPSAAEVEDAFTKLAAAERWE